MKSLGFVLLLALTPTLCHAQKDTSGITVIKASWTKERIGWERDPFSGPIENFDEVRARTRNEKRIEDAKRGNSAEIDRIRREAKADAANIANQHKNVPSRYAFVYKTTVKNLSSRTVKIIDWDYIFFDSSSEGEIGRQQFTSEEKIAPGKAKELRVVINKPPTQTVSITSLNTSERNTLKEKVVLVRIEFTDGTVWQESQNP